MAVASSRFHGPLRKAEHWLGRVTSGATKKRANGTSAFLQRATGPSLCLRERSAKDSQIRFISGGARKLIWLTFSRILGLYGPFWASWDSVITNMG